MHIITFCFCRDKADHFGLVRQFDKGLLLVTFDNGDRWCKPSELKFV